MGPAQLDDRGRSNEGNISSRDGSNSPEGGDCALLSTRVKADFIKIRVGRSDPLPVELPGMALSFYIGEKDGNWGLIKKDLLYNKNYAPEKLMDWSDSRILCTRIRGKSLSEIAQHMGITYKGEVLKVVRNKYELAIFLQAVHGGSSPPCVNIYFYAASDFRDVFTELAWNPEFLMKKTVNILSSIRTHGVGLSEIAKILGLRSFDGSELNPIRNRKHLALLLKTIFPEDDDYLDIYFFSLSELGDVLAEKGLTPKNLKNLTHVAIDKIKIGGLSLDEIAALHGIKVTQSLWNSIPRQKLLAATLLKVIFPEEDENIDVYFYDIEKLRQRLAKAHTPEELLRMNKRDFALISIGGVSLYILAKWLKIQPIDDMPINVNNNEYHRAFFLQFLFGVRDEVINTCVDKHEERILRKTSIRFPEG